MNQLIYILICFLVGVLIYSLLESYCSCNVVEGLTPLETCNQAYCNFKKTTPKPCGTSQDKENLNISLSKVGCNNKLGYYCYDPGKNTQCPSGPPPPPPPGKCCQVYTGSNINFICDDAQDKDLCSEGGTVTIDGADKHICNWQNRPCPVPIPPSGPPPAPSPPTCKKGDKIKPDPSDPIIDPKDPWENLNKKCPPPSTFCAQENEYCFDVVAEKDIPCCDGSTCPNSGSTRNQCPKTTDNDNALEG